MVESNLLVRWIISRIVRRVREMLPKDMIPIVSIMQRSIAAAMDEVREAKPNS